MKEWDWARENPAAKVGRERVRNARDRWLTFEEESRLLKACLSNTKNDALKVPRSGLKEIILFALNTGMRQDEIFSLAWSEVDLLRRTVTVLKSKNGEKRTIPLNQKMTDLLVEKGSVRSAGSSFVFPSLAGTKIIRCNLLRAFYAAVKRAGIIGFRFHDLRHTFATRLVQAGVDLYKVAKLLGHKDIRMTQRYAHHYPESLRDGVEVLDRLGTKGAQSNRTGAQTSEGGGTKLAHSNKKELTVVG
jgi:integrase